MTRRELDKAHRALKVQYETLLRIIVAAARSQGGALYIEKRLMDDQKGEWHIQTEPMAGGEGAFVTAVRKGSVGELSKNISARVN